MYLKFIYINRKHLEGIIQTLKIKERDKYKRELIKKKKTKNYKE